MSEATTTSRARKGGGGGGVSRQFPVGRRRYVPVVDAGCGCRPRRPRLLVNVPWSSFLIKPSFLGGCKLGGGDVMQQAAVRRSGGGGEKFKCSSTSSASFSSSSRAGTRSTGGYSYSSSACSSDYWCYGAVAAATKPQQQQQPAALPHHKAKQTKKKKEPAKVKSKKKMMAAEEEEGVGVAVEKESSDPRADFRDSMVAMVVEMGLCDWDGLRCMLRRLLALNAPRHHAAILTAFAEVCAQIVATPASSPQACQYHTSATT